MSPKEIGTKVFITGLDYSITLTANISIDIDVDCFRTN